MPFSGRSGPSNPGKRVTFCLGVFNITFRTTANELFTIFGKYGEVAEIYMPKNHRTGHPRGFAFVDFKYEHEAQKAIENLNGKIVEGREIKVEFARYGRNAEQLHNGKITEVFRKSSDRLRSRSPRPRYRDDYRERDYKRRSRSRSGGRYERDRYRGWERGYRRRSRSRIVSPDYYRGRGRGRLDDERRISRSHSLDRTPSHDESHDRRSPPSRSVSPRRQ